MTENERDDGGPAFPETYWATPYSLVEYRNGMALRDWLAGQAIAGLTAKAGAYPRTIATEAYSIADAMLAERASNNSE